MNFEVNDVTYFLAFNGDEGEWMLLKPARDGFDRLAVYDDEAPPETIIHMPDDDADHQPVN